MTTHADHATVLLGVPLDGLTMDQTVDRIGEFIADGRSMGRSHQIATVNVDFLVNATENPDLLSLLQASALNLADGAPVVWAAAALGAPVPERVAGSDLVPRLCAESAERGWKIHFFGGADGVARRAQSLLLERNPGALITADAGPIVSEDGDVDDATLDSIASLDADILCVALGNPKQEHFIARHADRLGCPVTIGIGGTLDMVVGDKRRAPRWMQRIGAEWLVRAAQDPRRLVRRYARDIVVAVPSLMSHVRAVRRHRVGVALSPEVVVGTATIRRATGPFQPSEWSRLMNDVENLGSVELEIESIESIEPRSHAALVDLLRSTSRCGVAVTGTRWSPGLDRCFADYRTGTFFRQRILKGPNPGADDHHVEAGVE